MSLKVQCASGILLVALVQASGVGVSARQKVNPSAAALADFTRRVDEYAALHKKLAAASGPLDETKSQVEIATREKALGEAIRTARAQAKQGDLFTPAAATVFKKLIADDFRRHPPSTRKTESDSRDSESADFKPVLNQTYPPAEPLETFPAKLLHQLPPLPRELEYRIVARYLILRDTEANIIVDFIPQVVP